MSYLNMMPSLRHCFSALIIASLAAAEDAVNVSVGVSVSGTTAEPPTAIIEHGVVVGTSTMLPEAQAEVHKYLGIPYAKSPPERFSPPTSPAYFLKPLMAQKLKPSCLQQWSYPEAGRNFKLGLFNNPPPVDGESEDCLYLNVFAPSQPAPVGGRAVMFWIYGGSYAHGSASIASYDASAFAAYQDVIVVTHNYRTNVFGFSNSPELPLDQRNAGFFDQRMALEWVQQNIAAFGGDPKKVTIFGESAGAFCIDTLLTSYTTETAPFRAAILESGQISYEAQSSSVDPASQWKSMIQALNCTTGPLECARSAPSETLLSIIEHQALVFDPVPDNVSLVSDPAYRRQIGDFAAVPMLIGTNANDGRVFEVGMTNLTAYLDTTFGSTAPDVIPHLAATYQVQNSSAQNDAYSVISQLATLTVFQCGAALTANQTASKGVPVWRYYFNASFPNNAPLEGLLEVWHTSEIPLVFQTYNGGPINPVTKSAEGLIPSNLTATAQQAALAQYMNAAWADFAKDPEAGPGWNRLNTFSDNDLAVLGADGSSGATLISRQEVDAGCQMLLPAFRAVTGDNVFGLEHA